MKRPTKGGKNAKKKRNAPTAHKKILPQESIKDFLLKGAGVAILLALAGWFVPWEDWTSSLFGTTPSPAEQHLIDGWTDLLRPSWNASYEDVIEDQTNLGPAQATCMQVKGGRAKTFLDFQAGLWPRKGIHAGVGIRSLSKIIASAAILAVIERGKFPDLHLGRKLGELFPEACGNTILAGADIRELMSMDSNLDNRLNAVLGKLADHMGFPPYCDTIGLDPVECIEQVICPAYKDHDVLKCELPGGVGELNRVVDERCANLHEHCDAWAMRGECTKTARYMIDTCPRSCGWCVKQRGSGGGQEEAEEVWEPLTKRVEYKLNDDGDLVKFRGHSCRYDNYSYTLIDGMVKKITGEWAIHWITKLIAEPLGMNDMLRCMEQPGRGKTGIGGCYAVPTSEEAMTDYKEWPLHPGGLESRNWIGTGLMASAYDMTLFMAMLAGNGTVNGSRVLSKESVDVILSDHQTFDHGGVCMGMKSFGLGLGHCWLGDSSEIGSRCTSDDWWGWGGSYGSRVFLLRDQGIACSVITNLPSRWVTTKAGKRHRLAARQHPFAHNAAEVIRAAFPLLNKPHA